MVLQWLFFGRLRTLHNTWKIYNNSLFCITQELAGEEDPEKLARYFTKQEEENFALFNYVNELSYEVEVLHETVQQIQDDIGMQFVHVFSYS